MKELLSATYDQGYNVARITSFTQLDDPTAGKKTEVLTFSDAELKTLGTPVSLSVGSQVNIAGQKAAMIGVVNDSTRGSMVAYNGTTEAKDCSLSLSKKGLFCFSSAGELFYVSKTGVETMETSDGEWSTKDISNLVAFNKSLYLFQKNPMNFASVLLTRYQNLAGSESQYRNGQNYSILAGSGANLPDSM